jgi:integrase
MRPKFARSRVRPPPRYFCRRLAPRLLSQWSEKAKPDLVNWLRPTLSVKRKPEFDRRVVEPWEYAALVNTLLDPPMASSHHDKRTALWRDASDAVQLLRLTGRRLNEVLRIKLTQFDWNKMHGAVKGHVTLLATKTESERDILLWASIPQIVKARIADGLTTDYLFPKARMRPSTILYRVPALRLRMLQGLSMDKLRASLVTHYGTPSSLL